MAGDNKQPVNDKKIIGLVAVLIFLGIALVALVNVSNRLLAGTQAFSDGLLVWASTEKNAVIHLINYVNTGNEKYYNEFEEAFFIIEGFSMARKELVKEDINYDIVDKGISRGRTQPGDVENAVWIYEYFGWSPVVKNLSMQWKESDVLVSKLQAIGLEVHQQMAGGTLTEAEKQEYIQQINDINNQITNHKKVFAIAVTSAALTINNAVYWLTLILGLFFLLLGGYVAVRFLRQTQKWGASIQESERKFRNVLENSQDIIYQLDREEGKYVYMSPTKEMIGYNEKEILEQGPEFIYSRIHPEDKERLQKEMDEVRNKRSMGDDYRTETEFRVKTKKDTYLWVSNKRSAVRSGETGKTFIVGNVRDISEQKKYERKIDRSLKEKEVLLQEIHHRVKNNLAVISGLLYLQQEELEESAAKSAFRKMQSRIDSVALIHEKLYGSESLSDIDLAEYITELTEALVQTNTGRKDIQLKKELQPVKVGIQEAVSFGLTVNELLTNAYKHAFNNRNQGVIKISLKTNGMSRILSISDNGRGLPDDFFEQTHSSFGMSLVQSLLKQLGAEVEINDNGWTEFKITF